MKPTRLKEKLFFCGLIFVIAAAMYWLKISCLFKAVFHIECPGCGLTRAYISLLRLDVAQAFRFHAMFWAVPVAFVMFLYDDKLFRQKWLNTLLFCLVYGGLLLHWVLRLILS